MPVILATQEAEIRRIAVRSQSWENSLKDPILKIPIAKKKKLMGSSSGKSTFLASVRP
jgi:hypothetical protein